MPDVVVVGAGAIGCATALELRKRGLAVTLVERDSIGSHASGFAFGGLYATSGAGIPGPLLPLARRAVERHKQLARELPEATGIETGFRRAPSLEIAFSEPEMERLLAAAGWQRREGFAPEVLDRAALLRLEPALASGVLGGVRFDCHFEVDSYRYTLALVTAFERAGGTLRHGNVCGITTRRGRAAGVRLDSGEAISADCVVLASGPWAGKGEVSGLPTLPVRPVKGEILRLRLPDIRIQHRLVTPAAYVARKPDGLVWVGTTEEEAGFDDGPSTAARDSITAGALAICPALADAELAQHTACLRPVSRDGLPVIGRIGEAEGVYAANGAGKKGILLSPVIAEMVAAAIGAAPGAARVPLSFSPQRFTGSRGTGASDRS